MRVAVTGARPVHGQSSLDQGHEVLTLTNSMRRFNPFGDKVKPEPFNFCNPAALEKTLRGVVGWFVDDVVITREEIRGLMEERLYVKSSPLGTTKLSDWVHANRRRLGLTYTSEMARRLDRVSEYRSN